AVSWALLSLATAGLALMVRPRRWLLAGACLAVGALARQEVLLVTAGAAIGAAAWWIAARRGGAAVERGVILVVLVGLLAVPIGAAHDWLLARDPLYSLQVPLIGAEGRALRGLEGSASFLFGHLREQLAVLLLAAVGVVSLVRNRSWTMLLGVVVLGPGMALFFLAVAARGLVTLDRYLGPMDVAILVAAAIGLSSLGRAVAQRAAQGRTAPGGRPALAASTVAAIAAALLLAPTVGPLDDDLSARARLQRATAADWRDLLPSVRAAVAGVPELRSGPATRDPRSRQLDRPSVLVSAGLLPIASVDLDLRLHRLARLEAFVNVPEDLEGRDGSLLYHVPGISITGDRLRWLEIDRPERLAGVDLEPLAAGSDRAWLIRVSAAQ
ncbi:MAG TPA: hypothetical protein VM344_02110, partial [Vitreimonas sp.]|nr:hypothetical protein [Vitreimonas sp.]